MPSPTLLNETAVIAEAVPFIPPIRTAGTGWCFRNHGISVKQRRATHDRRAHAFINYCGASGALTEAGRPPGFGQVGQVGRVGRASRERGGRRSRTQPLIATTGAIIHHGGGRPSTGPRPACPARNLHWHLDQLASGTLLFDLCHELTHWIWAEPRSNRQLGKRFCDQAYAMEERVAESGAAFLCADLRIPTRRARITRISRPGLPC